MGLLRSSRTTDSPGDIAARTILPYPSGGHPPTGCAFGTKSAGPFFSSAPRRTACALFDRILLPSIAIIGLLLGTGPAHGADKTFHAGDPLAYAHQESEKVTVGAKRFDTEELVSSAFGKKIDFARFGVVPVLLVVANKRSTALDLQALETSLVASDGRHVKAVAPEELPSLATEGKHPNQSGVRYPIPLPKKKNPLNAPEIATRAFAAKVLAPGDTASGFIYFEAESEAGDKLYVNGMRDARSGQDLLYFEFPLAGAEAPAQ